MLAKRQFSARRGAMSLGLNFDHFARLTLLIATLVAMSSGMLVAAEPFPELTGRLEFGAAQVDAGAAENVPPGWLVWKNGDTLPGTPLGAAKGRLLWKSGLFATPFLIDMTQLKSAQIVAGKSTPPKSLLSDDLSFFMTTGDALQGKLVGLTDTHYELLCGQHGSIEVAREYVAGFGRIRTVKPRNLQLPDDLASGNAHFRLLDEAEPFVGRLIRFDVANRSIIAQDLIKQRRTIPLENVASISLRRVSTVRYGDNNQQIRLRYHHGTDLRGVIDSMGEQSATLQVPWTEKPLPCPFDGLRDMLFLSPRGTLAADVAAEILKSDVGNRGSLHGTLTSVGEDANRIGWRPIGSANAAEFTEDRPVRFIRQLDADARPGPVARTDFVYLNNDDVIACKILRLDDAHAVVDCPLSDRQRIPLAAITAMEFDSEGFVPVVGFNDRGWQINERQKNAVNRQGDRISFRGQATLTHENLLQGDEISFDVTWNADAQCVVTVQLPSIIDNRKDLIHLNNRGALVRRVTQRNIPLMLYFLQNRLLVRGPQNKSFVGLNDPRRQEAELNQQCRAHIRISTGNKQIQVFVNNQSFVTFPAANAQAESKRVSFIVQPVAVRRVRVVEANGRVRHVVEQAQPESDLLTISNLSVTRSRTAMRFVNQTDEQIEPVLTIPRKNKSNPPSHLLVAHNGDLLRGKLVAMTDEAVHFKSRLDVLTIPRERITAIVRLKTPGKEHEAAAADDPSTIRAADVGGARLTFTDAAMQDGALVGDHPVLGKCHFLPIHLRELMIGEFKDNTIDTVAYNNWELVSAQEPIFPGGSPPVPGEADYAFGTDSPLVGTMPRDFDLTLLDGRRFRLSDHAGKIVVLEFWATWCDKCAVALPQIIEALDQFPKGEVVFVAVNERESSALVQKYLAVRDWNFTVGLDRDGSVARGFQFTNFPQMVIIGKSGKVERAHVGPHSNLKQELTDVLQKLVATEP